MVSCFPLIVTPIASRNARILSLVDDSKTFIAGPILAWWHLSSCRRMSCRHTGKSLKLDRRLYFYLFALTAAAMLIHGYHPGIEDAEIYTPGIKHLLNPNLYPFGAEFFLNHAR